MISEELGNLFVFLSADGSQIEVRVLAEISGDPLLIEQFRTGQDIHCLVGSMLTGWPTERIAKEKNVRKAVKNMHFGIVFGKARGGMYEYIVQKIRHIDGQEAAKKFRRDVSPRQVEKWYDKYFISYRGVERYQKKMRAQVESYGYVETLFAFRRWIRKSNDARGSFWANQAVNSPIQGTAHQFLLIALALLDLYPKRYILLKNCIMEVHDELVFRVRLKDLVEARTVLMDLFAHAYTYAQEQFKLTLHVPITAESKAGFCRGSMVDYAGESVEEFLQVWRKKQKETSARSWSDLVATPV